MKPDGASLNSLPPQGRVRTLRRPGGTDMVERRPALTVLTHLVLILGVLIVAFPVYVTFVASTHTAQAIVQAPMPLVPGNQMLHNYAAVLIGTDAGAGSAAPVGRMMFVSLVSALTIALGKIAISLLSAFAIVYFRFPFRNFFFWAIFVTLMLPVEVRIGPDLRSRIRSRNAEQLRGPDRAADCFSHRDVPVPAVLPDGA